MKLMVHATIPTILLLLQIFNCGAQNVLDQQIQYNEHVIVLTDNNFESFKSNNPFILVKFYAPWCMHCKSIAASYSELAQTYAKIRPDVKIAEVNATANNRLLELFNIQHFPTIILIAEERQYEFNGQPGLENYITWLNSKFDFPLKSITSMEELNALKSSSSVLFAGIFEKNDTSNEALVDLIKLARDNENKKLTFALVTDNSMMKTMSANDGTIIAFKSFDEPRIEFDTSGRESLSRRADMAQFVKSHAIRLLTDFDNEFAADLLNFEINVAYFEQGNATDVKQIRKELEASAKHFRGKAAFAFIDANIESNRRIMEYLSIEHNALPTLRILNLTGTITKYKFDASEKTKPLREPLITHFVQSFFNGTLKPYFKSQPLPSNWDKNDVKVIVRDNFEKVAMDVDKNVFVEFYAPWCGHCERLAPIFDQLAKHYKNEDDIVIAKMDSTANELQDIAINSFPTLKLFKRHTNEIIHYNQERTLDALINFIDGETGKLLSSRKQQQQVDEMPHEEL